MRAPRPRFVWRAPMGALAVLVGVIACSGIITGPDAGPDTSPRSMRVSPARLELSLTDTARMSANLYDVTGAAAVLDPSIPVRFRSADTLVARVDATGLVSAVADGTTTVTASYGALQLGIPVVVLARPRIVIVSGDAQTAEQGDTLPQPLVVRALAADGAPIGDATVTFTVTSGNGTLASVNDLTDANGIASARWVLGIPLGAQSVAVSRAGLDSAAFTATATAGTRPVSLALLPQDTTLVGAGITVQLSATVRNVAGVALPAAPVAYVSTVPATATVSATGVVTSAAPGITYIRASSGSAVDSMRVEVLALPIITIAPTSVALATTAGSSPAPTTIAVTNGGGSRLSGLGATVAYGAGATGWLAIAFDSAAAPATLTLTPSTNAVSVGNHTATVTIASTIPGVASRDVTVTLSVTSGVPLPKLQLGNDIFHPYGLQAARSGALPAPSVAPLEITLRSLDSTQVMLAADNETRGRDSITVFVGAGAQSFTYWMQGIADGFPAARLVAEAPGYEPDTIEVTLTAPAVQLTLVTPSPVPASGGSEPVLQVTVGFNDEGTLVPMQVRAFGPAPDFAVASAFPTLARVTFRATAATIGVDQEPTTSVTFALRPGRSATSLPDSVFAIPASLGVALRGQAGEVSFSVTGPPDYTVLGGDPVLVILDAPALALGVDTLQPAWLHSEREVTLPSTVFDPVDVTIRSLDPTAVRVSASQNTAGTAQVVTQVEGGTTSAFYWLSGVPGASGRTALVVAEAAGYAPDTMLVTVTRPAYALSRVGAGTVPATGGEDPVFVLTVGEAFGDGGFRPMALSPGITPPEFTLQADQPSIARVQFFASTSTVGADQGPASTVTFSLQTGQNSTSTGQFLGTPASLRAARTGVAGGAIFSVSAAPGEFDNVQSSVGFTFTAVAPPAIAVAPDAVDFATTLGATLPDTQLVLVTNSGEGALTGLQADVLYGAGASDWLFVTFDTTAAPATMRVVASPEFVPAGTFTATVTITSTVPGVAPVDLPVSITVTAPPVCDVGRGSLTITGAPITVQGTFCPQTGTGPVTPASGTVTAFWSETFDYGNGSYYENILVQFDGTTGAIVGVSHYLNDPTRSIMKSCSPLPFAPPPCTGVSVDLVNRVVTFTDLVLGAASPITLNGTLRMAPPPVVGLTRISGDAQSATVGTALAAPMVVRLTDANGDPIAGATVAWAARYGCCNTIENVNTTTDADGVATYTPTMPTIALPVTVDVSAAGAPGSPQSFTATPIPEPATQLAFVLNTGGGIAGRTVLPGWRIEARDRYANVDINHGGSVTVVLSNGPTALATLAGTTTKNTVNGVVDFGDLSVNVANSSWVLNASSPGLAGAQSAAFSISIDARMTLVNTPLVPLNGTAVVRVETSVPAYGTGFVVGLEPNAAGIVAVNAPTSVTLPVGDSIVDFTIAGVSNGFMFLNAIVNGVGAGQLGVTVSSNTISVPLTLNVPYTRTASLPINLTQPAPAGGTTIAVTSANPAIANVLTPSVFIAAGTLSGNAQLEGLALGQVAVTATGPNLATGTSSVRVTAALDIVETSATINAGFSSATVTTRLLSGGTVFSAPAGGIPLTFTSRDPACVAAPADIAVPTGLNSIATTAPYGGTAVTPCSTYLVVTSSQFDADSMRITVNAPPLSYLSVGATVGAGLSRSASYSLQVVAPAGGVVVRLTSSDPSRLVLSPDAATTGTASIDMPIAAGSYYGSFFFSGIEGQAGTTASVSMEVIGGPYTNPASATVTVNPIGIEASGGTSFTTLAADGSGTVYVGELTPAGPSQSVTNESVIRAGGQAITVTLATDDTEVVLPVTAGIAAASRTVTIVPGQSRTSYGIRPTGAGTATIRATSPSAGTPARANYPATITVSAPLTYLSVGATIGAGLTRAASFSFQTVAPPGGIVVTLTSSDPTRLVLAPDAATPGTASVDVTIPAGSYYATFYYSGIEGQAGTTAQVSMTVQGGLYTNPAPATVTVNPIGIEASGSTSFTTLGADGSGVVYVGEIGPAGPSQYVSNESVVRAGGQPITVTLTSSAPAVVVPVTAGVAASPRTVTIAPGQSRVNYGLRPTGAGTASIGATSPEAASPTRANYPATITVSAPLSYLSVGATVGAGLTRAASFSFQSVAPAGGVVVTLTSSDPTRVVLAPDAATVGTASIDVTIPAGSYYATFYYSGIEGQAGTTAQVSMSIAGGLYVDPAPATVTVGTLAVEASGSTTLTTLGNDGSGVAYVGELTAPGVGQYVGNESIIRAGGQPVVVTLTSTTPTVAVPLVAGVAASPRTVTIAPGQSRVNYGIRQLVAGTTTITAASATASSPVRANYPAPITVTSPSSSLSIPTRLGAGLAAGGSVSLQVVAPVGGVTVTLTSSDPARLLLAPNATTAGAAQITLPIAQGGYYTSFVVMALEDVTGNPTVTAQTPGFTDATATSSVEPIGVQWNGATSITTLASDGGGTAWVGIVSGLAGNQSISPEQVVRFGGVARTLTFTSSNTSVLLPAVAGVAQQGITTTIAPGQSRATVNVRPVSAGTATIAVSGNGLVSAVAPTLPQTVTVTVPLQYLSLGSLSQGSGLSQAGSVSLQTVAPVGGRTMTLTSSDPSRLLLAPDANTAGAGQITIAFAAGGYYANLVVMSPENVTGSVALTMSTAGYRDTTITFNVVQPAVTLNGPQPTRTIAQGDDWFQAQVGIPSGNGVLAQAVRFGAPAPLTVTLVSSVPAVGSVAIGGVVASPQEITIPVGQSITSSVVATRANFRPLSAGNTTITATIPGFLQQGNAIRTVTVTP